MSTETQEMLPIESSIRWNTIKYAAFGRELKISPKALANINAPGTKISFEAESVTILIGIGDHNSAHLIMSLSAWEALKAGGKIDISTFKELKKNLLG